MILTKFIVQHCAYDGCTSDLLNARGGVFCAYHEDQYGAKCRVRDCSNDKVVGTQACAMHQQIWRKHVNDHSRANLTGVCRMLQRPNEQLPWQSENNRSLQPHDEEASSVPQRKHFFSPSRFYCVETICAPCGVVKAWAKFAKAESPTNILRFMDSVYPTPESHPAYVCIDKACLVLRTAVANPDFSSWTTTSRFIVDAYHYQNHRTTDWMCQTYCNPAPTDGSAPNLVVVEHDNQGRPQYKRAFNTQACEQLNAWMGGFESILKRMVPGNFNWFLHAMLCYHTKFVIEKKKEKEKRGQEEEEDDSDSSD